MIDNIGTIIEFVRVSGIWAGIAMLEIIVIYCLLRTIREVSDARLEDYKTAFASNSKALDTFRIAADERTRAMLNTVKELVESQEILEHTQARMAERLADLVTLQEKSVQLNAGNHSLVLEILRNNTCRAPRGRT
jgi:hypothetical protein